MRVLIDGTFPRQFKALLPLAGVRCASELGWEEKRGGELLALAKEVFDVVVTMAPSVPSEPALGIVVLQTSSTRIGELILCVPAVLDAISKAKPGTVQVASLHTQ